MIKFQFAEIVNEDGSVRRHRHPVAADYRERLKCNLGRLAEEIKDFPDEPSHFNFNSTQLNRHLRHGETLSCAAPRSETDRRVRLTPYFRWKLPELRGGKHYTSCLCMKRNGLQAWCPRWACRGSAMCRATALDAPRGLGGVAVAEPRDPDQPVEASCCESWGQRAKEAELQLFLLSKPTVVPRGLF